MTTKYLNKCLRKIQSEQAQQNCRVIEIYLNNNMIVRCDRMIKHHQGNITFDNIVACYYEDFLITLINIEHIESVYYIDYQYDSIKI